MNGFGDYDGGDLDGFQQQFGHHHQRHQQQQPHYQHAHLQQQPPYETTSTFHATPSFATAHLTGVHLQQQQQQHRHRNNRAAVARKTQVSPKFPSAASMVSSRERNEAMFNKFLASHRAPRAAGARTETNSGGGEPFQAFSSVKAEAVQKCNADQWLETISVKASGISLEPLTGAEVLCRVRQQTDKIVTLYLPCVDFFVACQRELQTGLMAATQKGLVGNTYRDRMTPKEFFRRYIEPLHQKFLLRNQSLMEKVALLDAVREIQTLQDDARRVAYQGAEAMVDTFLGGGKIGESWGLRRWLVRHGGPLTILNDIEGILGGCQNLDPSLETTRKLAERLRPLAKQSLGRLKNDVPSSYQEASTELPNLPYFHRLESALRGMANFDPEGDDQFLRELCEHSPDSLLTWPSNW